MLERMLGDGTPITFASVARAAEVSTWLVYAPGVREAVAESRARQRTRAVTSKPDPGSPSLQVDLALARAEISRLRADRDQHQQQLRLALGTQLDNLAKAELIGRIDELTHANAQLAAAASQARADNENLRALLAELEDDLAAARTSLRTMIRGENRPTATTPPA